MNSDDSGITLIEVMVSMALMSVVTALFTTGIITIYTNNNTTERITVTAQQIHAAFVRLDRSIRYANGISAPSAAGDWVEYGISNVDVSGCYQLHLTADGTLQMRSQLGANPVGSWSTLASNLDPATSAFARTVPTTSSSPYQSLSLTLTALAGSGASARRSTATFSYTALNTSRDDPPSDSICNVLSRS